MSLLDTDLLVAASHTLCPEAWSDPSLVNYVPGSKPESIVPEHQTESKAVLEVEVKKKKKEKFVEEFPVNVTALMNEDQLWGCFYVFPELYNDVFSPVVRVKTLSDVPELVSGVLTRDVISCCLSYLRRSPLLGDLVYIKLDLSSKHLVNIEVLQHYKFLVYLDLSVNLLTELSVLSNLMYLQYLSVSFNRLSTVLEYDIPQWFLTEVHYKYNSVTRINDLTKFWSITLLDLSHNNIKTISGLENLYYLRHLDLSFNHIQRLENLNYLRLVWLDLSYNNISSFEYGPNAGLWTLVHLEYLNLNENNLTTLKLFAGCTRIQDLHIRNNRFSVLLELAVYMKQMRRLGILDLRANPICKTPGYMEVTISTFPSLLSLDAEELDPVLQRRVRMRMFPQLYGFANTRLLRLLYIEQLGRAKVSPYVPPADTTEVPIVIFVGYEATGKGKLVRRLVSECSKNVEFAMLHTTASYHLAGHYIEVTRNKFDNMLVAGDFLTYFEMEGESYGLSREQAYVTDGKLKITYMTLTPALIIRLRGRRPYLILTTMLDKFKLHKTQQERKEIRFKWIMEKITAEIPVEKTTLKVMVSGRIIITGILNEILMAIPDDKEKSEFMYDSQCSLFLDSESRDAEDFASRMDKLALMVSNFSSLENMMISQQSLVEQYKSLCSLYKESQLTEDYTSSDVGHNNRKASTFSKRSDYVSVASGLRSKQSRVASQDLSGDKLSGDQVHYQKSVDFTNYQSETWKGIHADARPRMDSMGPLPNKVVSFTSKDHHQSTMGLDARGLTGMLIELEGEDPFDSPHQEEHVLGRSVSTKFQQAEEAPDDTDLWFSFLVETGLLQGSDPEVDGGGGDASPYADKYDDPDLMMKQLTYYKMMAGETPVMARADYEDINNKMPGLFWDTISMDNPDKAFVKAKRILKNIIEYQSSLKPMFDIDFENMPEKYPFVKKKVENVAKLITPTRYFT